MNVTSMRTWLNAAGILAALLASTLALPADPLKSPRRMVNGKVVELSPLFKWWPHHEGKRPLTAWVHVTGAIVGTNGLGWVVAAQVEKTDHPARRTETEPAKPNGAHRVILKDPPLMERAEFERLSAQLKALNAQHAKLAGEEAQAKNRADALGREARANRRYGARSRTLSAEHNQAAQAEKEAKQELKPLDQQLQAVKKKLAAFPNPDHYEVDCFALELQQEYTGLPLYDHGQVYQ